jgi:hypothetical protein
VGHKARVGLLIMERTKVSLIIPFTFAAEGRYQVSIDKTIASIEVTYVPNDEALNKITGIVSEGKRQIMPSDPEGMVNISKVVIEFPFEYSAADLGSEGSEKYASIKEQCVTYLNRLQEVLRYCTNRYWLRSVSPYHLNIYNIESYDDMGKRKQTFLFAPPSAMFFLLAVRDHREAEPQISEMLMNETQVSLPDKLYLDALNFFHFFSFAEAIITANIALEVFVWGHLFERYRSQGKTEDEAKRKVDNVFGAKFRKIMKNEYFNNSESRLQHPIWQKLENVRDRRRSLVHPHTKIPSLEETKQVLLDIRDITSWVSQQK